LAESHELADDLARGLLTIALAMLAHGLAPQSDALRAGLALFVLIGTLWIPGPCT
jgi:hypothetical protein